MILLFVAIVFVGLIGFWWFDGYRNYSHLVKWKTPGSHFYCSFAKGTTPNNNGSFVFPLMFGFCFAERATTTLGENTGKDAMRVITELTCPTLYVTIGTFVFAVSYGLTAEEQLANIKKAEALTELRKKQDARERNKSGRSTNRTASKPTGTSGAKSKTNKSVGRKKG